MALILSSISFARAEVNVDFRRADTAPLELRSGEWEGIRGAVEVREDIRGMARVEMGCMV